MTTKEKMDPRLKKLGDKLLKLRAEEVKIFEIIDKKRHREYPVKDIEKLHKIQAEMKEVNKKGKELFDKLKKK